MTSGDALGLPVRDPAPIRGAGGCNRPMAPAGAAGKRCLVDERDAGPPRVRTSAALLAHVLVAKYADHLPLYRQSEIYARAGLDLDRPAAHG